VPGSSGYGSGRCVRAAFRVGGVWARLVGVKTHDIEFLSFQLPAESTHQHRHFCSREIFARQSHLYLVCTPAWWDADGRPWRGAESRAETVLRYRFSSRISPIPRGLAANLVILAAIRS
jgi:hypothetical protein